LSDLQNSFTAAKSTKFQTKRILGYPSHLNYVATLPWEAYIRNFALFLHAKHVLCDFLSSFKQISVNYHKNNVQKLTLRKTSTFYFLFVHCP